MPNPVLYYPHIHIREENWLKATLLAFGHVYRMVPEELKYTHDNEIRGVRGDAPFVQRYGEPLLKDIGFCWEFNAPIMQAQQRLRKVIEDNLADLQRWYSRTSIGHKGDQCSRLHAEKLPAEFYSFLMSKGLAWVEDENGKLILDPPPIGDFWLTMHADLCDACLSVSAIAIAQANHLDVVTSDNVLHDGLVSQDESWVIRRLLRDPMEKPAPVTLEQVAEDAVHVLFYHGMNLDKVSAEDVAKMLEQQNDLRNLIDRAKVLTQKITSEPNVSTRQKAAEDVAEKLKMEWKQHSGWGKIGTAYGAVTDSIKDAPDWIMTAVAGSTIATMPKVAAGLGIVVITRSLHRIAENYGAAVRPYSYLSQTKKLGAVLISSSRKV